MFERACNKVKCICSKSCKLFSTFEKKKYFKHLERCHRSEALLGLVLNMGRLPGEHTSLIGLRIDCIKMNFSFLGLVLHMRLVAMPTYKFCWSQDWLYKNELFKSVMTRDRFRSIMRFLNFGEEPVNEEDRLGKIKLLINYVNTIFPVIFILHKELSLDESMMLSRGRLVFRQYIKNKRHMYRIKIFELYTNDGVVLKTEIYSGWKFQDPQSLGQTGAVVLHLMEPYLDKGYHLFTDNWYNSLPLTKNLPHRYLEIR